MALVGADVDQLRALARTFEQAADRLEGLTRELSGRLQSTPWVGPDADRYRSRFQGESSAAIRSAAGALRAAATALQRNATEQDHASSGTGLATGYAGSPSGASSPSDNALTDALSKLLAVGGIANDVAGIGGSGFGGLTGGVISGAGVVTSLTDIVAGYADGDGAQTGNGYIGLTGSALGRINPALGIAA